jgi:hypothetical protein
MPRTRPGRHRAVDEVARLERELAGAQLLIDGLRIKVADANDARDKANERANLLTEADTRAGRLEAEVTVLRAALANARRVSVPSGERDVDDDDQPTEPIDVRPLWAVTQLSLEA